MTPAYRLKVLDTSDPRILEGLRITCTLIGDVNNLLDSHGIRCIIVIIPTKEAVYFNQLVNENVAVNNDYKYLIVHEDLVKNKIINYCLNNNISYIDLLPTLQNEIINKKALYLKNEDGHPTIMGYKAFASIVQDYLKHNSFLQF